MNRILSADVRLRLGKILREIRQSRGLTQGELASKSGVSRLTIWNFEGGKFLPRSRTLERVASALEVPVERLVGAQAPEHQPPAIGPEPEDCTEKTLTVAFRRLPGFQKFAVLQLVQTMTASGMDGGQQ